ncbi:helix-turn-helix transcriptional regulator, partial [Pseudomonas viridiflava]
PLSSVIQGTETMGRTAAHLLHQMLHGMPSAGTQILIPPDAINVQASSLHQPLGDPYVMQALLFIRQYACQGIKTAQVAAYVGISRSSLESHFRKVRGCSVHDEILRFKLAAAASGLENTDSAIADIARDCGFTSAQYLHTVFRREFGCTPREYQQGGNERLVSV